MLPPKTEIATVRLDLSRLLTQTGDSTQLQPVASTQLSVPGKRTEDSQPAGMISLRVVPDDLSNLLAFVEKLGKIAQHTTER